MEARKEPLGQEAGQESTPSPAGERPVDELGRHLVDEDGEPIRWATRRDRVVAWALALIVIGITITFAWSIATGEIFFR